MFNKGNCPVPSQLPASHCGGKPFFKHALDVAGGNQPQAENPACRILFYWDFCELRSKKHLAENSCLIK